MEIENDDLPDLDDLFSPERSPSKRTEDSQPPKIDLNSLPVGKSRLSLIAKEQTVVRPFTSSATVPKSKPTISKGPMNLASSLKLVSKSSVAKAQAAIEREGMKDLRAQTQAQAIVDAARIKNQPFPLQNKAMNLFSQGEEVHFESIQDRLDAAEVLRVAASAAFFIQLSPTLRWIWLKNERKKKD